MIGECPSRLFKHETCKNKHDKLESISIASRFMVLEVLLLIFTHSCNRSKTVWNICRFINSIPWEIIFVRSFLVCIGIYSTYLEYFYRIWCIKTSCCWNVSVGRKCEVCSIRRSICDRFNHSFWCYSWIIISRISINVWTRRISSTMVILSRNDMYSSKREDIRIHFTQELSSIFFRISIMTYKFYTLSFIIINIMHTCTMSAIAMKLIKIISNSFKLFCFCRRNILVEYVENLCGRFIGSPCNRRNCSFNVDIRRNTTNWKFYKICKSSVFNLFRNGRYHLSSDFWLTSNKFTVDSGITILVSSRYKHVTIVIIILIELRIRDIILMVFSTKSIVYILIVICPYREFLRRIGRYRVYKSVRIKINNKWPLLSMCCNRFSNSNISKWYFKRYLSNTFFICWECTYYRTKTFELKVNTIEYKYFISTTSICSIEVWQLIKYDIILTNILECIRVLSIWFINSTINKFHSRKIIFQRSTIILIFTSKYRSIICTKCRMRMINSQHLCKRSKSFYIILSKFPISVISGIYISRIPIIGIFQSLKMQLTYNLLIFLDIFYHREHFLPEYTCTNVIWSTFCT